MDDPKVIRILFVCMGNICRSPTAEGVMRKRVLERDVSARFELDSAGTHGYHVGAAPDRRAIRAAAQRGCDIAGLRARLVCRDDFVRFDRILAMDRVNLALLQMQCPSDHAYKLGLLLDYAPHAATDEVPDPYYGGPKGFERVLDLVEAAADGLIDALVPSASGKRR